METLLVHEDVCAAFLPKLATGLAGKEDVHYKADASWNCFGSALVFANIAHMYICLDTYE